MYKTEHNAVRGGTGYMKKSRIYHDVLNHIPYFLAWL